jgi:hypothetical protein
VLRAAGQTGTAQENIQDWLELDEGDPGFQLLVFLYFLNKCSIAIFFHLFSSALLVSLFPFIFFLSFYFLSFGAIFFFMEPDYPLFWMTSPKLIRISEGLL